MNTIRFLLLAAVLTGVGALSASAQPGRDWRFERRPDIRPVATVTFYEHADFRGASLTLTVGEGIIDLDYARFNNGARINDRISSIHIEGPVEVVAFEHRDYQGRALVVGGDIRNLDWIAGRWNDTISSLQIRPANRPRWR